MLRKVSKKHKRTSKQRGKQEELRGFSFGDRIRDKVLRIKKNYKYIVERSKYPIEDLKYVVIYKCTSEHGFNEQRVFKGSYKACCELKKMKEGNYE